MWRDWQICTKCFSISTGQYCFFDKQNVINTKLILGWVEPNNIHISTRRPENLSKYEDIGFNIYFDNEKLIEQCDIIIICFPPSLDNWAIVELKDAIIQRQQNSNKLFQPFFISVVSNMYINKIQKLLLIERIFARTHIVLFIDNKFSEIIKINNQQQQEAKDQLDSELNFGMQLFEDKQLIQQILIAFSFIFYGTKIKEEEFKLSDIQKNIQEAFLGQIYNQIDDNDLVDVASKKYEQRSTIFKEILRDIIKQSQS